MRNSLNRRIFLRGLGGACVAAPFLSSVAERAAMGQTVAKPKPLIIMFTHYGCVTTKWFPAKSHGALAASDLTATNLKPLAPFVNKLLIPRGIRAMNEWTANNTGGSNGRGQGNDPHLQVTGSYLTLQPVTPNTNNPFSFDQSTKFNAVPIGPSMDHVIAQQLSPMGTPLFMRVGNFSDSAQSAISYSAAKTAYPGLGKPSQVFSALTGLFQSGMPMSPDTYAAVKGKSVVDLVADDLATLERFDMSADDKAKLDAWKALLDQTGKVMTSGAMCSQDVATMLGAVSANISKAESGGLGSDVLTTMVTSSMDGADVYSAVATLAAACNYNPVIVLKYPPNYVFKGLNIPEESHALSHRLDNAGMQGSCYPSALKLLQVIDTYYAQKFANLLTMLDGIKEGDGTTLLDNSATVWFQEMSDGNAHNLNNLPIIQAGSAGGYFKQGWTINVDTSTATSAGAANLTTGNSESQCADGTANGMANGVSQGTGTDAKVANGPINKYYYALMNAVGVKAGADGFPAKGGTQPVTRFGYSDLTTDFNGGQGAVAGATIHSPGEYTALKAGT